MSRRRYLSTEISQDAAVNRLALEYGDFAVMLYTWLIPHAGDNGVVRGTAEEIMFQVVPGRRDKSPEDIEAALAGMHALGLIEWNAEARTVTFPSQSFYKHQSYIGRRNRRDDSPSPPPNNGYRRNEQTAPEISGDQRRSAESPEEGRVTPQNAVSFSSSFSFSSSKDDGEDLSSQRAQEEVPPPSPSPPTGEHPITGNGPPPNPDRVYRQLAEIIDVVGRPRQERALWSLRQRLRHRKDLVYQAELWDSKLGDERDTPASRMASFAEWMDRVEAGGEEDASSPSEVERPPPPFVDLSPDSPAMQRLAAQFPQVYGKGAS